MQNLFGILGSMILVSIFLFGIPHNIFDGVRGILLLVFISIVGVILLGWGIYGLPPRSLNKESE